MVQEHLSERDRGNETRADAPDAYGIQELRKEIQTLTSTVGKLAEGSKQQSWAQVARPALLAPQLPARRAREVLVTRDEGTSAQSDKSAAEIVAEVQSSAGGNGEIIGARKLPSGAIALTFKSVEAKNQWKDQGKVTSVFGPGSVYNNIHNMILANIRVRRYYRNMRCLISYCDNIKKPISYREQYIGPI